VFDLVVDDLHGMEFGGFSLLIASYKVWCPMQRFMRLYGWLINAYCHCPVTEIRGCLLEVSFCFGVSDVDTA